METTETVAPRLHLLITLVVLQAPSALSQVLLDNPSMTLTPILIPTAGSAKEALQALWSVSVSALSIACKT